MNYLRLGVNIDHVATIRNARGHRHPDPIEAALTAQSAGADGITAHLREDRRHISDDDIARLRDAIRLPLNLEMAATDEMLAIALKTKPNAACIVPEKRQELTTEGGLNVAVMQSQLHDYVAALKSEGIRVSLFIEAEEAQLRACHEIGADIIELHTGIYCDAAEAARPALLKKLNDAALLANELELECHAGHGLTYDTVEPIAAIPSMVELNIGHFLIGEAIFHGLPAAIHTMRSAMERGRKSGQ